MESMVCVLARPVVIFGGLSREGRGEDSDIEAQELKVNGLLGMTLAYFSNIVPSTRLNTEARHSQRTRLKRLDRALRQSPVRAPTNARVEETPAGPCMRIYVGRREAP